MKTKFHNNFVYTRDTTGKQIVLVGMHDCKACKKRCKKCHWPFSLSTATDEENFCSSGCEDEFFGHMQK